jgi:hypothetical protein
VKLQKDASEDGDVDLLCNGEKSFATIYRAPNRKLRAKGGFLQTKLASRLILAAVVVLFDIYTLVYLPPDTLTEFLSTLTCEVRVEDLHSNRVFLEFHRSPEIQHLIPRLGLMSRIPAMGLSHPRNDQTRRPNES